MLVFPTAFASHLEGKVTSLTVCWAVTRKDDTVIRGTAHDKNIKIGDLIFYGDQGGGVPKHVAISLGGRRALSHGSEAGPLIVDIDYRSDRRMTRRYI